jgi:threonine dehydratase
MNLNDVSEAKETLRASITPTALVHSNFFSQMCSAEVYLKLENSQVTNSFKIRGALNKMLHLTKEDMSRGVVTASAGNHAQAVAIGAEKLKITAKIIVPRTTPAIKINKIRMHNVQPILYGNTFDEAERKAIDLAKEEGTTYVSAYNDRYVIAGQGTVGLEILDSLPNVTMVIVPVGSGGLISGIGLAIKSSKSAVRIIGVQSEASPVMYESLKSGKIVDIEMHESIADGLHGGIEKGSMTFSMVQMYVDDLWLVKEKTIRKAIYLLWKEEKQIVEGSGAIAIAPILENKHTFVGETVAAVISGGNIDDRIFQNIIDSEGN